MSEEIANAVLVLLNAGADPGAMKAATESIPNLEFIPVEDLQQDTVH